MCGIFGYVGSSRNASEAVVEGLKRLDYRGYDSWGVAVLNGHGIEVAKRVGIVAPDEARLSSSTVAIGHTRWATHGAVTEANAHPHYASDRSFVLAHNGIVENAAELKEKLLKKGYGFESETDTEAIVRLVEDKRRKAKSLAEAVRSAFKELAGRNTIIVLAQDGEVIAARNGSPLVLGTRGDELYFSSDVLSFAPYVSSVFVMENGQMVAKNGNGVEMRDVASGTRLKPRFETNAIVGSEVDKGPFEHYMLKEIHEAPQVIRQMTKEPDANYRALASAIKKAKNVYTVGSGTAGAAAAQTAYYLRAYGGINAIALIGAEASEYYRLFRKGDLILAPSQSGETADVLEVLEHAKKKGAKIASHVNMPGSMMTRMSDFKFMAQAGPEICVMSTKIFVSQIAWGYLVAKAVGGKLAEGKRNLKSLANAAAKYLADTAAIESLKDVAGRMARRDDLYLLGKGQNLQIIKEGMVKIIEGSYVHAHGIPAGDLKHYAITLMEEGTPVIAVISDDSLKSNVLNAVHEVQARGAEVVGISPQNAPQFADWIKVPDTKETSAIMNVIPLQLLAYYMALARGNNIDKPRNIAKSVTVK